MSALVYAPASSHFYAFPLVVRWRRPFDDLAFYFPRLHFGLLEGGSGVENFPSLLTAPPQPWRNLHREYQPGELSQWQAYLEFLETLNYQDESDLKAAIRGRLEPVLPQKVDRNILWSLAYQLEQMLLEKTAGLERLARQQEELARVLAADLGEEDELAPLDATFSPPLSGGPPDLALARVRWQFWQEVLAPHLAAPWCALVLEPLAGESSPKYLWQAAQESGGLLWQADLSLPAWNPPPGREAEPMQALELGVAFGKMLSEVLQALRERPEEAQAGWEKLASLVEERLWPASGLPRSHAIGLEIFGWRQPAPTSPWGTAPMVFLTPADSPEEFR